MKVAVIGATGLIGTALCRSLVSEGHQLHVLSRHPQKAQHLSASRVVTGDIASKESGEEIVEGMDAVINLAGESIAAGRWSEKRKKVICDSRVLGTRKLVEAIRQSEHPPRILISASAVGYYGPRDDTALTEADPPGTDFLAGLCRDWEHEAMGAEQAGTRVVLLRTGLVLSGQGGALPRMIPPFKMFVGGPLGKGGQWMSWIHVDDEVGAIRYVLGQDELRGPFNLTAPNPTTNAEFTRQLARTLKRPAFLAVPGFALRFMFGEMADSLLLQGQRVVPAKLEESGYKFRFSELGEALKDIID